jgi:hypothetical protein
MVRVNRIHHYFLGLAFIIFNVDIHAMDLSGVWVLDGPIREGTLSMTDKAMLKHLDYDLLEDDPSLKCEPASISRVWANPNSRFRFLTYDDHIDIEYELFDLRRNIPLGDKSKIIKQPSTKNLNGQYFSTMGSSAARFEGEKLVIETVNHTNGYIRTSRGIPQSTHTRAVEEFTRDKDKLYLRITYFDETLFNEPFVIEQRFKRTEDMVIPVYDCTDTDYDWFEQLND